MTLTYPSTEQARAKLYDIIDSVRTKGEVVTIHTRKGTVVVMPAEAYAVLRAPRK